MPLQKSRSEHLGWAKVTWIFLVTLCVCVTQHGTNAFMQQRSPWQRSRSHPVQYGTPNTKPLLPVSDTTKNKLSKFHYEPPPAEPTVDDNAVVSSKDVMSESDSRSDNTSQMTHVKGDSMATPVTRLSWQDLMEPAGLPDDDKSHISPNERVLWDNKRDTTFAAGLSPMMPRRAKKRARSSSPTSSPSTTKPQTPTVNVKKLAQALRSPHADPTLELWDRYSLGKSGGIATPAGINNPGLAHLMISSSPQPLRASTSQHNDRNLRRAVSHGLNWPKRRKIEKATPGGSTSGGHGDADTTSKSSLVTALLDNITSSIHEESPESMSHVALKSPSPRKKRKSLSASDFTVCEDNEAKKAAENALSDYGDDDFDDETFMELDATIRATQNPLQVEEAGPYVARQSFCEQPSTKANDSDEFDDLGDLDDGIFDTGLGLDDANLQTPSGSGRAIAPKKIVAETQRAASEVADLEDEFGDLDEDIDFDAVEMAATQPMMQAGESNSVVRRHRSPK
jgi:DNA replication ATP-dependent helicase Dna2